MKKASLAILIAFLAISLYAQNLSIYCEDDQAMQFIGTDGKLTGMAVETVREIQRRVGNTDDIKMVPWARGLNELNSKPNIILFSMARTAERNAQYQWIGPIAEWSYGLYVKKDSSITINNLEDAKKVKSIGVYRDDIRDQFLTQAGFTNLVRSMDGTTNFKNLMNGRIDMIAASAGDILNMTVNTGGTVTDVKLLLVFLKTQLYIAASKELDSKIIIKWNDALLQMKKDGTFPRIFKKYYPDKELPGPAITKF